MFTVIPPHDITGGYAVLKGLQKGLKLPSDRMLPSFAGLREYGNTRWVGLFGAFGFIVWSLTCAS